MKKLKNFLLAVSLVGGFFWVLYSDLPDYAKGTIFMAAFFGYLMIDYDRRIKRVEHTVGLHSISTKEWESTRRLSSYKLDIWLSPNWQAIIEKLAKELNEDADTLIDRILKDEALEVEEGQGLYWQSYFHFVLFYDALSGLRQIWSDHDKTFLDDIKVRGMMFGEDTSYHAWTQKYGQSKIYEDVVMTEEFIGFTGILPNGEVVDEDKLSSVPFWEILRFLIEIHKHTDSDGDMRAIKSFPKRLEDKLEQQQIKYDTSDYNHYGVGADFDEELFPLEQVDKEWAKQNGVQLYKQRMNTHWLVTPYYEVGIRIEFAD